MLINTINQFNTSIKQKTQHPLISIIDFSELEERDANYNRRIVLGFYGIMYKGNRHCNVKYGRNIYDYKDGTLMFFAPEQVVEFEKSETKEKAIGWGVFFHPDLIRHFNLGREIKKYSFFEYNTSEALHISDKEKQIRSDIIIKIEEELNQNIDKLLYKIICIFVYLHICNSKFFSMLHNYTSTNK